MKSASRLALRIVGGMALLYACVFGALEAWNSLTYEGDSDPVKRSVGNWVVSEVQVWSLHISNTVILAFIVGLLLLGLSVLPLKNRA